MLPSLIFHNLEMGILTGPVIRVTLAPLFVNSDAISKPCFPDDLLLTNLIGINIFYCWACSD